MIKDVAFGAAHQLGRKIGGIRQRLLAIPYTYNALRFVLGLLLVDFIGKTSFTH